MKKIRITEENDFSIKVALLDGNNRALNIALLQRYSIQLRNRYWEPASFTVSETDDNAFMLHVDGSSMGRGMYSLEVKGVIEDRKVRAVEPLVFDIVPSSNGDIPSEPIEQDPDFIDGNDGVNLTLKYQFVGINVIDESDLQVLDEKIQTETTERQEADTALQQAMERYVADHQNVQDLGQVQFYRQDDSFSSATVIESLKTPGVYKFEALKRLTGVERTLEDNLLTFSPTNADVVIDETATISVEMAEQGWEHLENPSSITIRNHCLISFATGNGSTYPKYYEGNYHEVRLYPGNELMIIPLYPGNKPINRRTIVKVEIVCGEVPTSGDIWAGSETPTVVWNNQEGEIAKTFTFLNDGDTNNHMKIKEIIVTFGTITAHTAKKGNGVLFVSQTMLADDLMLLQQRLLLMNDAEQMLQRHAHLFDNGSSYFEWDDTDTGKNNNWYDWIPTREFVAKSIAAAVAPFNNKMKQRLAVHRAIPYRPNPNVWYYFSGQNLMRFRYVCSGEEQDRTFFEQLYAAAFRSLMIFVRYPGEERYEVYDSRTGEIEQDLGYPGTRGTTVFIYMTFFSDEEFHYYRLKRHGLNPFDLDSYEMKHSLDMVPESPFFRWNGKTYDCIDTRDVPLPTLTGKEIRDRCGNKIVAKIYQLRHVRARDTEKSLGHWYRWVRSRGSFYYHGQWIERGGLLLRKKGCQHFKVFPCRRGVKSIYGKDVYVNRGEKYKKKI